MRFDTVQGWSSTGICARLLAARKAAALATALFVTAHSAVSLAHEFTSSSVTIAHPWARATPPGARVGAAYLEIKAQPGTGDSLIGARAPGIAGRVEIHTHEHDGDVMKMKQLAALRIEPGKSVVFAPAGHHLMLMDLAKPLQEGDLIKLFVIFEKAGEIEVEATVEPIGARGPHGLDHQPGHEPAGHSGHDMKAGNAQDRHDHNPAHDH